MIINVRPALYGEPVILPAATAATATAAPASAPASAASAITAAASPPAVRISATHKFSPPYDYTYSKIHIVVIILFTPVYRICSAKYEKGARKGA